MPKWVWQEDLGCNSNSTLKHLKTALKVISPRLRASQAYGFPDSLVTKVGTL